ncbi:MAG: sensor histidine kinase [Actinomycetota bacterium]|nr:sensor histidine kinase [Actinomycetota bacterium]
MLDSPRWLLALTAVLTIVFVGSALTVSGWDRADLGRDLALVAANTLPLLVIGRNPLVVVLFFAVAYPAWIATGHEGHLLQSLPTVTAMYAVGLWDRPLWLRGVGLVAPLWMVAASLPGLWDVDAFELGYVAVFMVVVWVLGVVIAGRREYANQLEQKTDDLEAARAELAVRAVADERVRIARELHDVVAHAMSVITVQAGVAGHLAGTDPDQTGEALGVIERTGREALEEMRRMLTVLRDPGSAVDRARPQPGLAILPELVTQVGGTGVPVSLSTEGPSRRLPPGLDLAAYRVVQEALTNVVKHAPGARADVTVRYRPDRVEVDVTDHGPPPRGPITAGHGLRGMAERVALYDGNLETSASPTGFRVTASFPTEPTP